MQGDADLDPGRRYRYALRRRWGPGDRRVAFVLLNPSTADERASDPTLRRCVRFARDWGFDGLEIANCFALRTRDPRALRTATDPVGPENDRRLRAVAARAGQVVVGWGNHGRWRDRDEDVCALLADTPLWCLGVTRTGAPRHPLYVRADTALRPYGR